VEAYSAPRTPRQAGGRGGKGALTTQGAGGGTCSAGRGPAHVQIDSIGSGGPKRKNARLTRALANQRVSVAVSLVVWPRVGRASAIVRCGCVLKDTAMLLCESSECVHGHGVV